MFLFRCIVQMEKAAMSTSPALLAIDNCHGSTPSSINEGIRSLVGLIAKVTSDKTLGSCASESGSEEVLVDVEVDGSRYLLIRMPLPDRDPIRLSPREQEIVRMVAKGHPNKVIADVLNISTWTVCTHLRRIFAKLRVGSRAAMVAQLMQIGAIAPDTQVKPRVR
jgi:DNA-binding CsgD family transcriptional regulator